MGPDPRLAADDYKERHPESWASYFNKAAAEVYKFSPKQWADLYKRVFDSHISIEQIEQEKRERQEGTEYDFGTRDEKYGPGGEGKHHKSLRLWIRDNPAKVKSSFKDARTETELELYSGDRVDVVYHMLDRTIVLEVKSRVSSAVDLNRGVFQCIKYRAVKKAMDVRQDVPIEAILVTEKELPKEISALLKLHDIRHYQAPLKRA